VYHVPCLLHDSRGLPGTDVIGWLERGINTAPHALAGSDIWHKHVPAVIGAVLFGIERDDPCRPRGIFIIEQKQFHQRRMFRNTLKLTPPGGRSRREERSHPT
jgi:hypothetical protein